MPPIHAEFLVEDASTARVVSALLSRLRLNRDGRSGEVTSFGGKERMLRTLPGLFYTLARAQYADRVIVVIDQDTDDCEALKRHIHDDAVAADLVYRNQLTSESSLRIRIAMTELESWFIGDPAAVRAAFPHLTERDMRLRRGQHPDDMPNAWEWLERRLMQRGYFPVGMRKVVAAEAIAQHLDLSPEANASQSFRLFLRTLRETYELG